MALDSGHHQERSNSVGVAIFVDTLFEVARTHPISGDMDAMPAARYQPPVLEPFLDVNLQAPNTSQQDGSPALRSPHQQMQAR